MASELSQFIEKELKTQDVHDEEQQRLLDDLRAKPLPVTPLPFYKRGAFKKLMIVAGVIAVMALAVVGAMVAGGGQGLSTRLWNASKGVDGEGGKVVIDTSHKKKDEATEDKHKNQPGKEPEKQPGKQPKESPVPTNTKPAVDKVQKEDEDDVEDYADSDLERPKFDEEEAYEDYGEMIEKIEEENKEEKTVVKDEEDNHKRKKEEDETRQPGDAEKGDKGDKDDKGDKGDKDDKGEQRGDKAEKSSPAFETAREADPFDADYADEDDYGEDVQDPVTPEFE